MAMTDKLKTKREILKRAKPSTWLEVWWDDIPNTLVLVVEKPEWRKGDVDIKVYMPDQRCIGHVVHSQVIRVVGVL